MTRLPSRLLAAGLLVSAAGCASVAKVTNWTEPDCRQRFTGAVAAILEKQGESPETARRLAESTARTLERVDMGPRPFLVSSISGADYSFFVDRKGEKCLLRLYGRQKGFVSYTNDVTYIETEPLAPCGCAE